MRLAQIAFAGTLGTIIITGSGLAQTRHVLESCRVDGVIPPALCGSVLVAERREDPNSRRLELNVVVLPGTEGESRDDPLVFLAGGGVLPATRFAAFLHRSLPDLRRSRDILLVDQRGTGGSNPLTCEFQMPSVREPEQPDTAEIRRRVARCVGEISPHADLRAYSTTRAMHDLEQVRSQLGYDRLNIWGLSYGTTAAREYLRLYPDRVRSIVLWGVVPRSIPWWHRIPTIADSVLAAYYRRCAADPECARAFPDPRADVERLLASVARGPAADGQAREISADDVRRGVVGRLGERWRAVTIPLIVRRALGGDHSAFRPPSRAGPPPIPLGIYYGISCSEEFARQSADRIRTQSRGTFIGATAALQHLAVCAVWPTWPIETGLWEEVPSDVPALVLNGALDHVTGSAYAAEAARHLRRGQLFIVPGRGHNDFDVCIGHLIQTFVQRLTVDEDGRRCLDEAVPMRFPTKVSELPGRF